MSDWDVSDITSMDTLFGGIGRYRPHFNKDLSRWNVSRVTNMCGMFEGATSFNQRLGGQWATSTADKRHMFYGGCPGSIEGKTNDATGTPV